MQVGELVLLLRAPLEPILERFGEQLMAGIPLVREVKGGSVRPHERPIIVLESPTDDRKKSGVPVPADEVLAAGLVDNLVHRVTSCLLWAQHAPKCSYEL